jgi:two-component system, NtrC family, response regulator AtoC
LLAATKSETGPPESSGSPQFLHSCDSAMKSLEQALAGIAATELPVLIAGESGAGRRTLALHIHDLSGRRSEPFRQFSCANLIPEQFHPNKSLISTLPPDRAGQAGGTVYLHEITELSSASQLKLLQSLLGANSAAPRLIACTRRSLEKSTSEGHFLEDLYHRLNGVCLRVPPLRLRRDDIPAFIEHFLTVYSGLFQQPRPELTTMTMRVLHDYAWPGNLRELENIIRTIVATGNQDVASALVRFSESMERKQNNDLVPLKTVARAASLQAQRELILKALSRTRWNRKQAAEQLQISYKALLYKLKEVGLADSDERKE